MTLLIIGIFCCIYGTLSIVAGIKDRPRNFWFGSPFSKKTTTRSMRINNIVTGIVLLIIGISLLYQAIETLNKF
jgi:uncharacterized membrane protein HdeD (DUF308 family)